MLVICMFCVRFKNHHNIFLARPMGCIFVKHHSVDSFFAEDATKIETLNHFGISGLVYDVVEATHEGLVPTIVEEFERNTTYFLQGEFASDSPFRLEESIGNIDDNDTHVPNVVEFQVMIDKLQRLNELVGQCF